MPCTARPVPLQDILDPDRVLILECHKKVEALDALIDCLTTVAQVKDRKDLADAVFRREELMSTGIGLGIAVPHVRLASVDRIVMAAAACRHPIEDYESLDGQPVRLIFMVAAGREQHAQYLKLLSALSARLKDEELRARLVDADDPEAFYHALIESAD